MSRWKCPLPTRCQAANVLVVPDLTQRGTKKGNRALCSSFCFILLLFTHSQQILFAHSQHSTPSLSLSFSLYLSGSLFSLRWANLWCHEAIRQFKLLDPAQMRLHSLREASLNDLKYQRYFRSIDKHGKGWQRYTCNLGASVLKICLTVPCRPAVPLPIPTEPVRNQACCALCTCQVGTQSLHISVYCSVDVLCLRRPLHQLLDASQADPADALNLSVLRSPVGRFQCEESVARTEVNDPKWPEQRRNCSFCTPKG